MGWKRYIIYQKYLNKYLKTKTNIFDLKLQIHWKKKKKTDG